MFFPHSCTVRQAVNEVTGVGSIVVAGTKYGTALLVNKCHIQPATITEGYGVTGPDLEAAWLLIAPLAELTKFTFGALVSWNGRQFKVMARPKAFADGLPIDHIEVELEELKVAES